MTKDEARLLRTPNRTRCSTSALPGPWSQGEASGSAFRCEVGPAIWKSAVGGNALSAAWPRRIVVQSRWGPEGVPGGWTPGQATSKHPPEARACEWQVPVRLEPSGWPRRARSTSRAPLVSYVANLLPLGTKMTIQPHGRDCPWRIPLHLPTSVIFRLRVSTFPMQRHRHSAGPRASHPAPALLSASSQKNDPCHVSQGPREYLLRPSMEIVSCLGTDGVRVRGTDACLGICRKLKR